MKLQIYIPALLLICVSFIASVTAQNEIAVIAKTVGTVSYQYNEQSSWQSLKAGTLLFNNAIIRTADDGFATLIYLDDKSRVTLRPKSELVVSASVTKEEIEKKVQMKYGESLFEVSKDKRRFKVETPTSVASVKGTKFFVVISQEDLSTAVYGITGLVGVRGTTGSRPSDTLSVTVSRRMKAIVPQGGAAILDTLTEEEFNQLLLLIDKTEEAKKSDGLQHAATLVASKGGSVHPDGKSYLNDNSPLQIQAYPNATHAFIKWQTIQGQAFIQNPFRAQSTLSLNGSNATVEALFSNNSCPATLSSSDGGATQPEGAITVQRDSSMQIEAFPAPGFAFSRWEGEGAVTITEVNNAITTVRFADTGAVKALFEKDTTSSQKEEEDVLSDTLQCILTVDGKGSITPQGSIKVLSGNQITLKAKPKKGYLFSHWDVIAGNAIVDSPTVAQTTATLFSTNAFIKAVFTKEIEKIKVTVIASEDGTTTPAGSYSLSPFEATIIEAHANSGYLFSHWTISSIGANYLMQNPNNNTVSLQPISGDLFITPHFEKEGEDTIDDETVDSSHVLLTLSSDGNCVVKGDLKRELRKGRHTTLRAEVLPGYTFDHWEVLSGSVELESPDDSYSRVKLHSSARIEARTKKLQQIKVRMSQSSGASKELRINYIDSK